MINVRVDNLTGRILDSKSSRGGSNPSPPVCSLTIGVITATLGMLND